MGNFYVCICGVCLCWYEGQRRRVPCYITGGALGKFCKVRTSVSPVVKDCVPALLCIKIRCVCIYTHIYIHTQIYVANYLPADTPLSTKDLKPIYIYVYIYIYIYIKEK